MAERKRDFFSGIVAPGLLLGGVAVTGYRAYNQIIHAATQDSPWKRQKDAAKFVASFKGGLGTNSPYSKDQILGAFFNSELAQKQSIPGLDNAIKTARGFAIEDLVKSFTLQNSVKGLGVPLDSLGSMSSDQLSKLLDISPEHSQHMEILAKKYGLLGTRTGGSAGAEAAQRLVDGAKSIVLDRARGGSAVRLSSVIGREAMSMANAVGVQAFTPDSLKGFTSLRPATASQIGDLFEEIKRVNRTTGSELRLKLITLQNEAEKVLTGVRIDSNKPLQTIPIEDAKGQVRWGRFAERTGSVRRVMRPDAEEFIKSTNKMSGLGDFGKIFRRLDEDLLEHAIKTGVADMAATGKGFDLNTLITKTAQDTGAPIIETTANKALNMRYSTQATLRPLGYREGASPLAVERIRELMRESGYNPLAGLSATQASSNIVSLPTKSGRVFGSAVMGLTGDNKAVAQNLRPTVIVGANSPSNTIWSRTQKAMGEGMARIKTLSVPGNIMNSMLQAMGRGDINLHEDEMLLMDRLKTKKLKTYRIPESSFLSSKLNDLLTNDSPHFADFRRKLAKGLDRKYLNALEVRVGELTRKHIELGGLSAKAFFGGKHDLVKTLDDEAALVLKEANELKALRGSVSFAAGDVLGLNGQGVYETIQTGTRFEANRIAFRPAKNQADVGSWVLQGETYSELSDGDKVFGGRKAIIKGKLDSYSKRKLVGMYLHTQDDPILKAAIEAGDQAGIDKFFKSEFDRIAGFEAEDFYHGDRVKLSDYGNDDWKQSLIKANEIQAIDVQGNKKIGSRGLAQMAGTMAESVVEEFDDLVAKEAGGGMLSPIGAKRKDLLERMLSAMDISKDAEGSWIYGEERNLANQFDRLSEATVKLNGRGRWSANQFFKDLSVAKDFTDDERAMFSRHAALTQDEAAVEYLNLHKQKFFAGGKARTAMTEALENQLRFGISNITISPDGRPQETSGAGRRGSYGHQMHVHAKAQGGAMGDVADELYSRLLGNKTNEARNIYRRVGIFYKGTGVNSISLSKIINGQLDRRSIEGLFSKNQQVRSKAFQEMRAFGGVSGEGLTIDMGERHAKLTGHRYVFHPEQISTQTGGYVTAEAKKASTESDSALRNLFDANPETMTDDAIKISVLRYKNSLADIFIGRDKAANKMLSGNVAGSLRLQAQSQMGDKFLEEAFGAPEFRNKIGLWEQYFDEAAEGLGADYNKAEDLERLRKGTLPMVVSRDPATGMHRISSVNAFSADEAIRLHVDKTTSHLAESDLMQKLFSVNTGKASALAKKIEAARPEIGYLMRSLMAIDKKKVHAHARLVAISKKISQAVPGSKRLESLRAGIDYQNEILANLEGWRENLMSSTQERIDLPMQGAGIDITKAYQDELFNAYTEGRRGPSILVSKQMEMILGADYDNDHLNAFLVKDRALSNALGSRTNYQESLITSWQDTVAKNPAASEEAFAATFRVNNPGFNANAEEDFLYKVKQRRMYENLKKGSSSALTAADLEVGSDAWKSMTKAEQVVAELEKKSIGAMSNAVDFSRAVFRKGTAAQNAKSRLMGELLFDLMPETPLKIRQAALADVPRMKESIEYLKNALSGRIDTDMPTMVNDFKKHLGIIHGQAVVNEVGDVVPDVLEAARKGAADPANRFQRILKSMDNAREMMDLAGPMMVDGTIDSIHAQFAREAFGDAVAQGSDAGRHIKNTAATLADAFEAIKKHKGPALIGVGAAIATAMLLGSTGSISAEEANMAGARHQPVSTPEAEPEFNQSAPVNTGSGKSIRIRGRTSEEFDSSQIAEKMRARFPGADLNFTVNDFRDRINREFIRKRMERE